MEGPRGVWVLPNLWVFQLFGCSRLGRLGVPGYTVSLIKRFLLALKHERNTLILTYLAAILPFWDTVQLAFYIICVILIILPSADWPVADDVDNCQRHITRQLKN